MHYPIKVHTFALAVCGLSIISSVYAHQVFLSDFDPVAGGGTGNTSITAHTGSLAIDQTQAFANRISLATTPLPVSGRPGSGVIRFETRQEDGNYAQTSGNRAELKFADQSTNGSNTEPKEIWYAWSIYAPDPVSLGLGEWDGGDSDRSDSGNGGGDEIYIQIHGPDGMNLAGNPENPPVALYRRVDAGYPANKGKWRFLYRWGKNNSSERVGVDIGTFEFNRWTDFVMRVVWSNNSANPGAVQLWMNGAQVVDAINQRVGYANMGFTYFKEGIYAYGWNNNRATDTYRVIAYYDEVKIHEGATTYANMKPRGGATNVPAAPSGLATGSAASSTLTLTWSDNSSDEQGFRIDRKQGSGSYAQIANLGAGVVSFADTGLAPDTAHTYRVFSYNATGSSPFSNESTGMTLAVIPTAPTGLIADAEDGAERSGTRIKDDFSASNSYWTDVAGGLWKVTGGKLQLTAPATPGGSQPNGNIRVQNTGLRGNFIYTLDAVVTADLDSVFDDFAIIFGYASAANYYYASFNENDDTATNGIFYYNGKKSTQLVDFTALITPGTTYTIKVEYIGTTLRVYRGPVGGALTLCATYDVTLPAGSKIGVGSKNDTATFDNILVLDTCRSVRTPRLPRDKAPGSFA